MVVQVTQWFTERLGYEYDPMVHGNSSEWLSDLISISFTHPPSLFKRSMRSLKAPPLKSCMNVFMHAYSEDHLYEHLHGPAQ